MSIKNKLYNFFKSIFSVFSKKSEVEYEVLEESSESESLKEPHFEEVLDEEEEKINISKRMLITKLYVLKQEIEVFKLEFPNEYHKFMEKIQSIEENYNSSLEESRKTLTFEIDPEIDSMMIVEVQRLERKIKKFINTKLKYYILSKRLQSLIVKLNILYNVSISYPNEKEKQKVLSQIEHAKNLELSMVQEFKESDYILNDIRLKERIVTLISYVDYEILKTILRNSDQKPDNIFCELILATQFVEFNYSSCFKSFIQDELSDLSNLLTLASKDEYVSEYKKEISKFLKLVTCSSDEKCEISDVSFWKKIFYLESVVITFLKQKGIEKENAKIKIIDRMDIKVTENEVLTLPKTNAYLALTSVFSVTQDEKILLLIMFFNNLSDEITYKDIYFLLVLFEITEVIQSVPNSLTRNIKRYIDKYPYNVSTIGERKKYVKNNLRSKEYLITFNLDGDDKKIIQTFEKLNLDFKIVNNKVCINSFYFNGLENLSKSFKNL